MMTTNISFYGSHNAAFAVERDGKILVVAEVERFVNYKNSGICQYKTVKDIHLTTEFLINWIMKTYNIEMFDNCIINCSVVHMDGRSYNLHELIPYKQLVTIGHHEAHASGVFYQSPYDKALIFSFDGGGDDGKFNIYIADRKLGVKLLDAVKNPISDSVHTKYDLGFPYATFGEFFQDITREPLTDGNLVYPGKIMGLCAYGTVHEDWVPYFMEYYKENAASGEFEEAIQRLIGDKINVTFDINNRLSGQTAYDVAATSQRAFEECFLEIAKPYMDLYPDLPICITGGCALNIILNTRLVKEFGRSVFVGPAPNDAGLATGLLLAHMKPESQIDVTYKGIPLTDINMLSEYMLYSHRLVKKIVTEIPIDYDPNAIVLDSEIVNDLANGLIIGVVRGNSEHGPRALGNRSILCDPAVGDMKNILNAKVKNREWYRPFAPVVRLEDVNTYFEWEGESRWMSFCPKVREEYKEKLAAIVHVDGTARVQTVTREQNKFLYDILTKFKEKTGVGVLLNTSFNVGGRPILSTVKDAFKIFNETHLDRLIIEDFYFTK
jgi:carbamoyltransferase